MANQNFRVKHGLEVNGNTLITGITTVGSLETAVGTITDLKGTNISISGIASLPTLDTTNGEINYLTGVHLDYSGIASVTKLESTNVTVGVGTFTTIDVTNGTIDILSGTDINVSGAITASSFTGDLTGGVVGNITGNAGSATTLETSRSFSVSGDVATSTGVSFDGSADVNLSVTLSNTFDASTSGIITASKLSTGAVGTGIYIDQSTISGPSEMVIDPAGVGDNTGSVRIKGDLLVDGQQLIINSETITLGDFVVGIASTATTDSLADGAGIQIGPDNTLLYDHTNTSLKSSENFNLAEGKSYKINGTDVLSYNTLGSTIFDSSLTSVGTLGNLNVSGIVTATTFDGNLTGNVTGNVTGIAEQASELVTARTFTVLGDVATVGGVTFDGTADVDLTVSLSSSFDANTSGIITATKFDSNDLNVSGMATISQIHLGGLSPDGSTFGISGYVPVANGSNGWSWQPIAAAGGGSLDGISVLEEGSSVGAAGSIISLNFTGDNVTATATGTSATIDFSDTPTYQNVVSIQSDDGNPARLDLYCEVTNAHYTRLQAAAHTEYSGNVTVTLPVIDGTMIVGGANSNTVDITTSGDITANSFIKSSNSGGFLKADGTEDTNTYLTSETSHSDVLVDGDFTSNGFMKRTGAGTYAVDSNTYLTSYTETDPVVAAINGIVKSNGTTISAAVAGTDYLAPTGDGSSLTNIVTGITAGVGVTISASTGNVTINATATGSALTLKEVASRTGATNTTVSNVEEIRFNNGAGFSVLDEGSGVAFVDLGSTFNPWYIDGQDTLKATGEEPIEFVAGPGIAITTKAVASVGIGTTFSKAITINAKGYVNVGGDFPSAGISTTGDTFYHTDYGKIFVYYDGFWVDTSPTSGGGGSSSSSSGGGGATVTTSDNAPSTPSDGDLWWDSSSGKLKIYYDDGQDTPSAQWADASPPLSASTISSVSNGTNSISIGSSTGFSDKSIQFSTNGARRWNIQGSGSLIPEDHDSYDIGSAEYKVRDIYEADSSDARLKTDIADYTGGLEFVESLRVVDFTWKEGVDGKPAGNRETGLIAQEVKEALDASNYNSWRLHTDGDRQGVDKKQLIPALISAVQELTEEVRTLRSRVQELENK